MEYLEGALKRYGGLKKLLGRNYFYLKPEGCIVDM